MVGAAFGTANIARSWQLLPAERKAHVLDLMIYLYHRFVLAGLVAELGDVTPQEALTTIVRGTFSNDVGLFEDLTQVFANSPNWPGGHAAADFLLEQRWRLKDDVDAAQLATMLKERADTITARTAANERFVLDPPSLQVAFAATNPANGTRPGDVFAAAHLMWKLSMVEKIEKAVSAVPHIYLEAQTDGGNVAAQLAFFVQRMLFGSAPQVTELVGTCLTSRHVRVLCNQTPPLYRAL